MSPVSNLRTAVSVALAALILSPQAFSATKSRTATADPLNVPAAWTGGVPGGNDIASWDTLTASLANSLGGNVSWQGLKVTNTSTTGPVVIGTGNTLTVGFNGIDLSSANTTSLTIQSGLTLRENTGQIWNVNAGRTLTLDTGAFTRSAGATLNVQGTGSVIVGSTYITNNINTGIIGAWATQGSALETRYATVDGSGKIIGLAGVDSAASAVTDTTGNVNYNITAAGTLPSTGNISFNTLRYKGAANGTISGDFAVNGILNAGAGLLNLTGNLAIGASNELVIVVPDSTRNISIASNISNNGSTASSVTIGQSNSNDVFTNRGAVTLSGTNTYSGITYIQSGILNVRNNAALGSSTGTSDGTVINTANRGRLDLSNVTTAEALSFVGGDPNSTYYANLFASGGTSTLTGTITLAENVRFGGNSGTVLNIKGGISTPGTGLQLVFNPGGGTINITDNAVNIGTTGNFYFDQGGTIFLGVGGNTWSSTTVATGTLKPGLCIRVNKRSPQRVDFLEDGVHPRSLFAR